MAKAQAEITIPREPDDVWEVVSDFGGLGDWMPGVESCRLEGDDRVIALMGMEVREHLVRNDAAARVLEYSITDGVPVESHRATITVAPDGDGAHVTWDVEATPDEMAGMMAGIYQQALEALRTHLGG